MKLLGIDYGTKNIGLAISDGKVAVPLKSLPMNKNCVQEILDIIRHEDIEKVIVGMPVTFTGAKQNIGEKAEKFVKTLHDAGVNVFSEDERLSSRQVEQEAKTFGRAGRAIDVDAAAAALILQSYLDKQSAV